MKTLQEYKSENIILVKQIDQADRLGDNDEAIRLKKQYHSNKLAMLDLISMKNKHNHLSARELREKIKNAKPAIRYETGLPYFDHYLYGGLEVGSLVVLGGQSGAGKSHMLLKMLANVSEYSKTVFFNFEMGERRLNKKLNKLLTTDTQIDNFIIDGDSRDLDNLLMEIVLHADDGVKFFAVDSKMKITVKGSDPEYMKISKISNDLSRVAIQNDIIIFLINQISEDNLKTGRLAFKGSGDQLYDADMALFITIEEELRNNEPTKIRKLICGKNRQDEHLFDVEIPPLSPDEVIVEQRVGEYIQHEIYPVHEVSYEMPAV